MNYYSGYYTTTPYPYSMQQTQMQNQQIPLQQQQVTSAQNVQQLMPQTFQQPVLNGKIVDSADIVKVTEVPVGGYGVFPRADMGEVYIKTWGQDGTTQIITYKPVPAPQATPPQDINSQLLEKINALETKIDNIILAAIGNVSVAKKEEKKDESTGNTTTSTTATKF